MGDTVVVQGAGPVGLAAAAFAHLRGAARVVVIGAPAARLELAGRLGAERMLDLGDTTDAARVEEVHGLTGGRGADVVIEASGTPAAVGEAVRLVRDGGVYVIAGHYTDAGQTTINPHLDLNRKHLDVRGQWGTRFHHVARALAVLARHRGRLPFADVIGRRYGLDEAAAALADVEALAVTKAVIEPGRSGVSPPRPAPA
jgi:L-iditol 2-dehydrogenase